MTRLHVCTRSRSRSWAATLALASFALSCSDNSPTGLPAFQVALAKIYPTQVGCFGQIQDWEFTVELVNTRPDTVAVLRVETNAYIIRASDEALLGKLTYQFQSLPFGNGPTLYDPSPAFPGAVILQPRNGDRVMKVQMQSRCLPGIVTSGGGSADVYLTVYVWTTVGLFTSLGIQIHHAL